MTGILIIFYNVPKLLLVQHDYLKRFCTGDYELIVVDNSTDPESIEAICYHSKRLGLEYLKTNAASMNGSQSHAFALTLAYQKYKNKYDILVTLDHDCIPIRPFSPAQILASKKIAGLGQQKGNVTYMWPGCTMFRTEVEMDFSIVANRDTGGATNKAIQAVGKANCTFFNEEYAENPSFNKSQYNFYALINNKMFAHFINGSNWAGSADNEERLNSLFNELEKISNVQPIQKEAES